LERELDIKSGETTPDGVFSLEGVRCLGACALAPIIVIDEEPYGEMTPEAAVKLIRKLNSVEAEAAPVEKEPKAKVSVKAAVDLSAVPPAG
jgi:(2Fe-2S) ferredoxin